MPPSHNTLLSHLLTGELDRFRESVDPLLPSYPVLHLAYWHVKTLVRCYTHYSISSTDDLLDAATASSAILISKPSPPPSPLTHHFATLAALVLSQLVDVKETRETAIRGLHELADAVEKGRILSPHNPREEAAFVSWDSLILERIGKKLHQSQLAPPQQQPHQPQAGPKDASTGIDHGGLQHLADLAVGESEGQSQSQSQIQGRSQSQGTNGEKAGQLEMEKRLAEGGAGEDVNWAALMRSGYLNIAP